MNALKQFARMPSPFEKYLWVSGNYFELSSARVDIHNVTALRQYEQEFSNPSKSFMEASGHSVVML